MEYTALNKIRKHSQTHFKKTVTRVPIRGRSHFRVCTELNCMCDVVNRTFGAPREEAIDDAVLTGIDPNGFLFADTSAAPTTLDGSMVDMVSPRIQDDVVLRCDGWKRTLLQMMILLLVCFC
mmetsp:Transcript_14442/g.20131  ORF Transcript_14442/g.20131 Transcript_14442/m.20131 type:complete len:122 (-) Transcript_14442:4-369(-)